MRSPPPEAARTSVSNGRKCPIPRVRTRITVPVSFASMFRVRSGAAIFPAFSEPRDNMSKKSVIPFSLNHGESRNQTTCARIPGSAA